MIVNKKTDLDELGAKVLNGISKALRKLAETSAANNENLIVGDKDGNVTSVPAKELLKGSTKEERSRENQKAL